VSKHFGRLIDIFANLDDEGGIPRQQAALARVEVDAISRLMERDRRKIEALERERDELRAALADLLGCGEEPCSVVHHEKEDRHNVGEPCPVLARYRALLGEEAT
jgi:hypothetical protein